MSTYNMVTVAAAIRNSRDRAELTAKELTDYAIEEGLIQRTQLLGQTEARLQAVRKDMYAMNVDRLKTKLRYRENQSKLAFQLTKLSADIQYGRRKEIADDLDQHIRDAKKLLGERDALDDETVRNLNRAYNAKMAGTASPNEAMAKIQSLVDLNRSGDFKDIAKPGIKKGHANAMRNWMEGIEIGGQKVFDIDPTTDVIRNIDALRNSEDPNNPLLKVMDRGQIISAFEPKGSNLFDQYNKNAKASYEAYTGVQKTLGDLEIKSKAIREAKSPEDFTAKMGEIKDELIKNDEAILKGSGIDTANLEQLTEEMRIYDGMKRSEKRLEAQAAELVKKNPSVAVQIRNAMARRMSSPYIRAWAKDNGFDELGHVTVKDGKYDPDTYIPGRDDLAVVAAFNRQAKRGAGRYGFKSIGTGDMVQVTVDGEPVVGERLKFHAADPVGMVRIMTESGEVVTVSPGQVDQIVVIERRPDRMSPLEQRAKGRAYRMGDQIRAARERAGVAVPGSELGAKVIKGGPNDGSFVIDPDNGRYIDTAEYNQTVDDFLNADSIVGKVVDGKQYLQKSVDGTTFEVVPGEGLVPVSDPRLKEAITAAPARRVVGQFAVEGQEEPQTRLLNRTDTSAEGLEIVMEPLRGEENYSEETKQYFDNAESAKRSGVGLEDLGYKATDQKFSSLAGQTYKNEYNIGGMKFVELDKAPPLPPSPSEGLTPGVDGPAEQPTGMPGITEQIETAAAQMEPRPETPETVTDQPTEPERVDKGEIEVDPVASQWNMQAQLNAAKGEPPPAVPEGYEVVQGEGLRKITEQPAPTPQQPPTPPADELDTSELDLEAITGTPQPTPAPTPTAAPPPPPATLSDDELDAISAPESDEDRKQREEEQARRIAQIQALTARIKGKGKDETSDAELPAELEAALSATPESAEEEKPAQEEKTAQEKKPSDPVGDRLQEVEEEDEVAASVGTLAEPKGEIDVPPLTPEEKAQRDEQNKQDLGASVQRLKDAGAGGAKPTPTQQAQADADANVRAAANALAFISAAEKETEEPDEVNKDSGKVTSGAVYGQTHADSMSKLKDMEERLKQFKRQQDLNQAVKESGDPQGLGTPPTQ